MHDLIFLQPPNNVIRYVATGTGSAGDYFLVTPTTGEVLLINSVADITQSLFTVSFYINIYLFNINNVQIVYFLHPTTNKSQNML